MYNITDLSVLIGGFSTMMKDESFLKHNPTQGTNAWKVICGRVYSAYILKPVLSGRNL